MEVRVHQKPVEVILICDECDHQHEEQYNDFCDKHGDPCDWNYEKWKCPECGHVNEFDGQDWNY